MNEFESLGFFDFEDFVTKMSDEQLIAVNGGCGGVEKTYGKYSQTPQAVMSRFGYDAFYYKKVQ